MFRSLITAGLLAGVACSVVAAEQPNATAILDVAIKAHGGEAALRKIVGVYMKYKWIANDSGTVEVSFFEEWFEKDKERALSFDQGHVPVFTDVFNANKGWIQDWGQQTDTMSPSLLSAAQDRIYENWITTNFVDLKANEYKLSVLPEIEVAGGKAIGLLVERKRYVPVKLYFDKETHLLYEMRCKINDVQPDKSTEHAQRCAYSDYRNVQGTKQPFKAEILWDGSKIGDMMAEELRISDKPFDKQLFVKP